MTRSSISASSRTAVSCASSAAASASAARCSAAATRRSASRLRSPRSTSTQPRSTSASTFAGDRVDRGLRLGARLLGHQLRPRASRSAPRAPLELLEGLLGAVARRLGAGDALPRPRRRLLALGGDPLAALGAELRAAVAIARSFSSARDLLGLRLGLGDALLADPDPLQRLLGDPCISRSPRRPRSQLHWPARSFGATYYGRRRPPATRGAELPQFARELQRPAGRSGRLLRLARVQVALEDLAGRVARQLVEELDLARRLVAGEVRLDVGFQVVLGDLGLRVERRRRPSAAGRTPRPRPRSPPPRPPPRGRRAGPRPRAGRRSRRRRRSSRRRGRR